MKNEKITRTAADDMGTGIAKEIFRGIGQILLGIIVIAAILFLFV